MRVVKHTTRGLFSEKMLGGSKSDHILMMELPHFVDRAILRRIELRGISESGGDEAADGND
jgi:hypothetical protein